MWCVEANEGNSFSDSVRDKNARVLTGSHSSASNSPLPTGPLRTSSHLSVTDTPLRAARTNVRPPLLHERIR